MNAVHVILQALRTQNIPIRFSSFSPDSLRQLFPSLDSYRPSALTRALFPHLHHQPLSVTSSAFLFSFSQRINGEPTNILSRISSNLSSLLSLTALPIELTRQECIFKRKELEKIRDDRAEALGRLSLLRGNLSSVIKEQPWNLGSFLRCLACIVEGETSVVYAPAMEPLDGVKKLDMALSDIQYLSVVVFTSRQATHQRLLDSQDLRRPSRLTLQWPQLLLLPPLCIYAARFAYNSRATLAEVMSDAKETLEGFFTGWLIEPLKEVLKTVRAGGEDGVIVRKEAVAADLQVKNLSPLGTFTGFNFPTPVSGANDAFSGRRRAIVRTRTIGYPFQTSKAW